VVAKILPNSDTVQKVVSISRGMALGYTLIVPDEDRYLQSRAKFEDDLAGLLGGRAAEEIVFHDITTGASNDLERATKMARAMVTQYGMSTKLGPRTFGKKEDLVFLGREISEQRNYSDEVAQMIDSEVRAIIDRAHSRAKETLTQYRDRLDALAKMLIDSETVDKHQFDALFA
jgi:cell division protease FtsH